jgi:hypothetical protein
MLAPKKRAELQSATQSFNDKCFKSGKLLEYYLFPDMKGLVSIWNIAFSEESARIAMENPSSAFSDNEFIPLVELDVAQKVMKGMMEAPRKAAKK